LVHSEHQHHHCRVDDGVPLRQPGTTQFLRCTGCRHQSVGGIPEPEDPEVYRHEHCDV